FIIGWLAIAGVPPFAGFWSKDEILLFAYDKSPILWALALVAALLTAYYMTRQVIMVFFGKARWNDPIDADADDHADDHGHHVEPHESPATMTLPLVALAGLAAVGGVLNLPFSGVKEKLLHWLEPLVHHAERELSHGSEDIKWVLAGVATAVAVTGIVLAYVVYQKRSIKAIEPTVLAKGWYYDSAITDFMGGPGRDAFEGVAWFDANVIDGAVNGTGKSVQGLAGVLRKAQNGLVRTYAALIGVGVVLLLVWFL
ncbi:MAG TPA: proton-conducting transporter membrane subunit, partial [Ilumatobacteraceae bacterium]|nr:proton-conducting transporter membrane subunit [Ilumatobacteraceae bacterium]